MDAVNVVCGSCQQRVYSEGKLKQQVHWNLELERVEIPAVRNDEWGFGELESYKAY